MGWVGVRLRGLDVVSSPAESGTELQPKTDFQPPDLEIWPLC